jgi:hypothetical protein
VSDSSVLEVVRAAVATASPRELRGFDEAARAFAATPHQARRALRGRHEPTASGWAGATELILGFLIAVAVDLAKDGVLFGTRATGRSLWNRMRRRSIDLDAELPPLGPAELATFERRAEEAAIGSGASPELARRIAVALSEAWPRRP